MGFGELELLLLALGLHDAADAQDAKAHSDEAHDCKDPQKLGDECLQLVLCIC